MKKFLRVFVPIFLAIAIVLCLAWYLFVYDRDFTRDVLLSCARYFENQNDHEMSSWFYDQAYQQAGDNDAVAIELAQQHKRSGNYTKAEYTLTNAIADGGGAELYVALSKLYIEQDKILDAVKLLDAVCRSDSHVNTQVTQTLSAMRPAAPTASPAPGFYNQYISVEIRHSTGVLYVNTHGEYPSVHTDSYPGPIALADGENTIYAVTVSEEGLASPLAIFGYTIGGVIEEVHFHDTAIETQIRKLLNAKDTDVLFSNDLWDIKEFTVPAQAKDLTDLQYMSFLEKLSMDGVDAEQLKHLSGLANLTDLTVKNTEVSSEDLAMIGSFPKLQRLTLSGCGITHLSGLEKATQLTYLDLSDNTIRNIEALRSMTGLTEAYLQHNVIHDLSALSTALSLSKLDVSYNALSNLSPIYANVRLTWLSAANNAIADLGDIQKLQALEYLDLNYNKVTGISKVASLPALKKLYVSNNALKSISDLASVTTLEHLDFSYNQVTDLPKFTPANNLVSIDGSYNKLTKLDALAGLPRLNKVSMDYNEALSSIEPLARCPVLILVNVYGTKVTEVKALTDQSIVVNYNPVQED